MDDGFMGGQHSCALGNCAYCYKRQLTEACEVIEALMDIPDMECPHCAAESRACEMHAEAEAFLVRVREGGR